MMMMTILFLLFQATNYKSANRSLAQVGKKIFEGKLDQAKNCMSLPVAQYTKHILLGGIGRRRWADLRRQYSPLSVKMPSYKEMRQYEQGISYATQHIDESGIRGIRAKLGDIVEVTLYLRFCCRSSR